MSKGLRTNGPRHGIRKPDYREEDGIYRFFGENTDSIMPSVPSIVAPVGLMVKKELIEMRGMDPAHLADYPVITDGKTRPFRNHFPEVTLDDMFAHFSDPRKWNTPARPGDALAEKNAQVAAGTRTVNARVDMHRNRIGKASMGSVVLRELHSAIRSKSHCRSARSSHHTLGMSVSCSFGGISIGGLSDYAYAGTARQDATVEDCFGLITPVVSSYMSGGRSTVKQLCRVKTGPLTRLAMTPPLLMASGQYHRGSDQLAGEPIGSFEPFDSTFWWSLLMALCGEDYVPPEKGNFEEERKMQNRMARFAPFSKVFQDVSAHGEDNDPGDNWVGWRLAVALFKHAELYWVAGTFTECDPNRQQADLIADP